MPKAHFIITPCTCFIKNIIWQLMSDTTCTSIGGEKRIWKRKWKNLNSWLFFPGQLYKVNRYKIEPRVFLITDGKATPAGLIAGPDAHTGHDLQDVSIKKFQKCLLLLKIYQKINDVFEIHCLNRHLKWLDE